MNPTITQPTTVTIAGSVAVLSSLITIPTKPIDVAAITRRTLIRATLDLPSGVTLVGSPAIEVNFEVADHDAALTVNPKIVFTNLATERRVTSVDPVLPTAVVIGSASKLASLQNAEITLTIDLTGQPVGSNQIPITANQLYLPDGVSLQQLVTSVVTVTVQ